MLGNQNQATSPPTPPLDAFGFPGSSLESLKRTLIPLTSSSSSQEGEATHSTNKHAALTKEHPHEQDHALPQPLMMNPPSTTSHIGQLSEHIQGMSVSGSVQFDLGTTTNTSSTTTKLEDGAMEGVQPPGNSSSSLGSTETALSDRQSPTAHLKCTESLNWDDDDEEDRPSQSSVSDPYASIGASWDNAGPGSPLFSPPPATSGKRKYTLSSNWKNLSKPKPLRFPGLSTTHNGEIPTATHNGTLFLQTTNVLPPSALPGPGSVTFREIQEAYYQDLMEITSRKLANLVRPAKRRAAADYSSLSVHKLEWWQFLPVTSSPLSRSCMVAASEEEDAVAGQVHGREEECGAAAASLRWERDARQIQERTHRFAQLCQRAFQQRCTPPSSPSMEMTVTTTTSLDPAKDGDGETSENTPGEWAGPKSLETSLEMRLYLTKVSQRLRSRYLSNLFPVFSASPSRRHTGIMGGARGTGIGGGTVQNDQEIWMWWKVRGYEYWCGLQTGGAGRNNEQQQLVQPMVIGGDVSEGTHQGVAGVEKEEQQQSGMDLEESNPFAVRQDQGDTTTMEWS